jgi:aspartyl-tRNA(Asn)/glutamyl-tRNA(Gln) amidotransferase subunit B
MPDIHSAAHARDYCKELWRLMTFAGVSDGDLYHGNMRFDVNISVAEKGAKKLGTRAEIKNLNSFRSVERAAEYEFKRQVELIESGEKVKQETRGWSDATGKTTSQRSKEEAQDYRYMPDPDIPPVNLTQDFVDTIKAAMPLLPPDFRAKFSKLKIQASALETLLDYPALANRLAEVLDNSNVKITEKVANLFTSVLLAEENTSLLNDPLPSAPNLIELSEMADSSELSSTAMKAVFLKFFNKDTEGKSARELAKEMNLLQENDESALEKIVDEVLALPETKQAQEDIKNGEMKALGFLVGQIMKHSQGKANPAAVQTLLKKKLA